MRIIIASNSLKKIPRLLSPTSWGKKIISSLELSSFTKLPDLYAKAAVTYFRDGRWDDLDSSKSLMNQVKEAKKKYGGMKFRYGSFPNDLNFKYVLLSSLGKNPPTDPQHIVEMFQKLIKDQVTSYRNNEGRDSGRRYGQAWPVILENITNIEEGHFIIQDGSHRLTHYWLSKKKAGTPINALYQVD